MSVLDQPGSVTKAVMVSSWALILSVCQWHHGLGWTIDAVGMRGLVSVRFLILTHSLTHRGRTIQYIILYLVGMWLLAAARSACGSQIVKEEPYLKTPGAGAHRYPSRNECLPQQRQHAGCGVPVGRPSSAVRQRVTTPICQHSPPPCPMPRFLPAPAAA